MKFTTRQLVTMAVFGALWGVVEISLGSVLHAIRIPLTGLTLTSVGLLVALIGRLFVPKRGSTFFIGVIAMVLKLFSIGNIIVGPMIGILAEALVAELDSGPLSPTHPSVIHPGNCRGCPVDPDPTLRHGAADLRAYPLTHLAGYGGPGQSPVRAWQPGSHLDRDRAGAAVCGGGCGRRLAGVEPGSFGERPFAGEFPDDSPVLTQLNLI